MYQIEQKCKNNCLKKLIIQNEKQESKIFHFLINRTPWDNSFEQSSDKKTNYIIWMFMEDEQNIDGSNNNNVNGIDNT